MSLSEKEKKLARLEIRKSKIKTSVAISALNKAVLVYFVFLVIGTIGFVNGYIHYTIMNLLIIAGILALVLGGVTFIITLARESKNMNQIIEGVKKRL